MAERNIRVNTLLMARDSAVIGQYLTQIYQRMEALEVSLAGLEGFWEGEAKVAFFQTVRTEWEQLERERHQLELWWEKWEQIRDLYHRCERQVADEIKGLRF